ncbi:MAG: MATE family efflux transporter [Lachnospiraceae bacterium]|nr:MATE family efflux transporter [Lachnospiraceae bacterium]
MKEESFYKKVWALVLPMALQNLINVGVTAADVVMLGKVDEKVLSGASLGGQVPFILNLFLFGIASGAAVLTAQYWGKKDADSIEKILGIALVIAMAAGVLFSIVTLAIPKQIMGIFTNDEEVIGYGVGYLRILAFTYPIVTFTATYLNIIKTIERVVISTIVYASSLCINIIMNGILIFGLFGAPRLGVAGAAIATLCARISEAVIVAFYAHFRNKDVKIRLKYMFRLDKQLCRDFLLYSGPVIVNELLWGLGVSANSAIMGHLGSSATAAYSVAQVTRQLAMVIVLGLANATAIMIGKVIGEKREDIALLYAKKFVKLTGICSVLGSLLVIAIRPFLISGLEFSGQAAGYMRIFLIFLAVHIVFYGINITIIVGILRSGGDTRYGMCVDTGAMWCGSILCGFLAAFVFRLPVEAVYAILLCDEVIKIPFAYTRYRSKKWLKNVTRN